MYNRLLNKTQNGFTCALQKKCEYTYNYKCGENNFCPKMMIAIYNQLNAFEDAMIESEVKN